MNMFWSSCFSTNSPFVKKNCHRLFTINLVESYTFVNVWGFSRTGMGKEYLSEVGMGTF